MKKIFILLAGVVTFFSCSKPEIKTAKNQLIADEVLNEDQLNLIFEKSATFPNNTQLAFAFIEDSTVNFYGVKRVNDTIIPVENQSSVFEIGSISKVFTSQLLAKAVKDGTISLEDKINNHLPFQFNNGIEISFKQLANHTSGLPRVPSDMMLELIMNFDNPYKNYSVEKLEKYLSEEVELDSEPGEKYAYSNLGAGLLAHTLGIIEGKTYEELLQENIFSSLSMSSSTTVRKSIQEKLIIGLDESGEEVSNWDANSLAGAGAILSSVEDLSKFALAQIHQENPVFSLAREKTHTISENREVALGWHISKRKSGNIFYWHNGGTGGYTSCMIVDVESKKAVIVLSNVSAFSSKMGNIDSICFGLMK